MARVRRRPSRDQLLVDDRRTYQLPTSSVVRTAEGRLSLQFAPESQGLRQLTARFENVPARMWADFPAGVPRPTGPINLIYGRRTMQPGRPRIA